MISPLLAIDQIRCHYGAIQALHGVSLRVDPGETVVLLGANGAGKSTLLRAVTGLMALSAGTIHLEGQPLQNLPAHHRVRRGLSLAPEGRQVFPRLTVRENLALGAFSLPSFPHERFDWVLELFPRLQERLPQAAGTLSGGEQQMLAIARALMSRPKLLLLDEPSLGLAPLLVKQIFDILREIAQQGLAILLVEQNAHQALRLGQRAYVLESGVVTLEGSTQELLNDPRVRAAYLGENAPPT